MQFHHKFECDEHPFSAFMLQSALGISALQPTLHFSPHPLLPCPPTILIPCQTPDGTLECKRNSILVRLLAQSASVTNLSSVLSGRALHCTVSINHQLTLLHRYLLGYWLIRTTTGQIWTASFIVQIPISIQLSPEFYLPQSNVSTSSPPRRLSSFWLQPPIYHHSYF